MNKRSVVVMPATLNILQQMGEQIKLARLRRQLSAELIAERAGISRATLWNIPCHIVEYRKGIALSFNGSLCGGTSRTGRDGS